MSYYVVKSPAKDYVASTLEQAMHVLEMLQLIGVSAIILQAEASLDTGLTA